MNNMHQHNQQRMQQPPNFISTKDLAYLTDAMSWELLAMKKCHHFAQECNNNEIRQAIERAGRMHEKHYKMLLKHLDPSKARPTMH
ncbi:MAG: hypothetical protein PWR10_517 [Halanaerobiales bacterium]|nr:hypothetical protein [Halanaerobiales bacterium]